MNPDQYTISEKKVPVGSGHRLYAQLWGKADAADTVIYLHGGPGSGCKDSAKQLFDPTRQRVIFFDQRGCGKSVPYGSLKDNDTQHLCDDISKIADAFAAEKFILVGGSWGSLLALAYATMQPARIKCMVLRGIFTGRASEIDFLDKGAFRAFFPDVWEKFVKSVPQADQANPGAYHLLRVLGKDKKAAKESAFAYAELEGAVATFDDRPKPMAFETFDPVSTIIECHYLANKCFLPEGYILKKAPTIKIKTYLVQGRYDMVCPPTTAFELAKQLPHATLAWTAAGHSGNDRANWEVTRSILSTITEPIQS